ncbi:transmembrane protein alanine and leucine rich [Bifidobacterium saguini DSM 23967]|uniref:Transmembrane protein alanine and leucine rich n=2 Tax=Bifidobacterium saguini TaxID=762210 RepID=A0A087D6G9_9BIFI|nr:DUF6541 family protein [Bifidobacterium saguini]KFI91119.1 transmembrane protein alanine and leucine rich [Bifidobacterium saguini DSM 23967]QTB90048.1 hypothetical protein BSD967_06660 [Bifidobacterium saguini]
MSNIASRANIIRRAPAAAVLIGTAVACGIVIAWFPDAIWDKPIQGIDAPAHYYFTREIMNDGLSVATSLLPNGGFYPPLFHTLAAFVATVGGALGIPMFTGSAAVVAAVNCVWILGGGILWPLGMALFCGYFFRNASIATRSVLYFGIPILAVSSGANPFQMLYAGPLIAYAFASNLLPYLLLATLYFLDAFSTVLELKIGKTADKTKGAAKRQNPEMHVAVRQLLIALGFTAAAFLLVMAAQPKLVFTYIVIMLPYAVFRLPWKLVAAMFGLLVLGAIAFFIFAVNIYPSAKYFHPETWFHTHRPSMDLKTSLTYAFTDGMVSGDINQGLTSFNIPTVAGWAMLVLLVVSIAMALVHVNKQSLAVLLSFALVLFVFECSATFTGAIPNIVTAVWYRNEVRTLTMLPFVILPVIALAGARLDAWLRDMAARPSIDQSVNVNQTSLRMVARIAAGLCAALMVMVMIGAQTVNPVKTAMRDSVNNAASLDKADPTEQLTHAKLDILTRMVKQTGTNAVIISDPMNGSMYATALFNANMLFPVYNPQNTGKGVIFSQVEQAFGSGNGEELLNTACGINPQQPTYFLSMGPQAPSLQFSFAAQYDPFHDAQRIEQYVADGTMTKVQDYSSYGDYAKDWALYQLQCPAR